MNEIRLLSVVVPVFNEEENISFLCNELCQVLERLAIPYEIIFSDDGSTDKSFFAIQALHAADRRVKGFSLSRNFGHQIALLAGLKKAKGDVVVMMDGDGQHPADKIPHMLAKLLEGFDIVNTRRADADDASLLKNVSSRWFYSLINRLSDIKIEPASADFRMMNRKAVDAFLAIPENDRFTRGLISWMGFRQVVVDYKALPRKNGRTKYSFSKMMRFAVNGITSFSAKPLRFSLYLGIVIAAFALLYGIYAVVQFLQGHVVPGWTSILLSVLFIGGSILINMGIMGEYIARIFTETKNRPLYYIKDETPD